MTSSLTRDFVETLAAWPADDDELLDRCRLLLIDGIAVGALGAREPGPRLVAALVQATAPSGTATVIGHSFRTSPAGAARINGMAMHVLDFEPMWDPANHAISPLLPALLALSEERENSDKIPQGRRVLVAMAKGIEAQGRLRLSSGQLQPGGLSLHPPGIVGPIATALACATLLRLDVAKTVAAVGIAASSTGGLLANVGSHTKALHCGNAAERGVEAALLAEAGFTSSSDALGDARGWGRSFFADSFNPDALVAPIGRGRALEPGPSWKLYPSEFATHFVIEAAIAARNQLNSAELANIRRVELRVPSIPYIDRPLPTDGHEGKFSWQYTAVLGLLDGHVTESGFFDERRFSPDVVALLSRTALSVDPCIPGTFSAMHAEVAVHLNDGTRVTARCDAPAGSWSNPVGADRVMAKAKDLLDTAVGGLSSAKVISIASAPVDSLSIRELLSALM